MRVLMIEGLGMVDWMETKILGDELPSSDTLICMPDPTIANAKAAWQGVAIERCSFEHGKNPVAIDRCKETICGGNFDAVLVCDLSLFEGPTTAGPLFEQHVGPLLQQYVSAGGAVAFTSAEGFQLQPTLQRLFGTVWERSSYYRTNWSPVEANRANVSAIFPPSLASRSFSAKACSVRGVPLHERMFATTPDSRTQSHVPFMNGRPVGERSEPDSVLAPEEDYDVVVAMDPEWDRLGPEVAESLEVVPDFIDFHHCVLC